MPGLPGVRTAVGAGIYPYYHPIAEWLSPTEVRVDGRRVLMAGSNDYLALAREPRVVAAAAEALSRSGPTDTGPRLLNGHPEAARTAGIPARPLPRPPGGAGGHRGYQANLALAALLGRDTAVFADRENHASLTDAVTLGRAVQRRYRHRDLDHLDQLLSAEPGTAKVVVTDGVFSAGGDLCDLAGIVGLTRAHHARVVVDGGHNVGLLGRRGRGVPEHLAVEDGVDLVTVTLSKCFGSLGGVLAGPAEVIRYLRHHSRSLVFAASLPPANAAAALAALDIIEAEPFRRHRVFDLAESLHNGLRAVGFRTGGSQTPIVPVQIGDAELCLRFWTGLLAEGVFTNAMVPPGVPVGGALIRVVVTAAHTAEEVDRVVEAFAAVGRRLGVVPPTPPEQYEPVKMASPRSPVSADSRGDRR